MLRCILCSTIILFILSGALLFFLPNIIKNMFKSDEAVTILELETKSFDDFIRKYNKSYNNADEYLLRKFFFTESLKNISRLNKIHGSSVFGVNKFSDWSSEELNLLLFMSPALMACQEWSSENCPNKYQERENQNYSGSDTVEMKDFTELPDKIDWTDKVGPVLDQKRCRGCWAMGIVGIMETMWAIYGNPLSSLSIQEVLDCTPVSKGCEGGDVGRTLDYLCSADYPIVEEASYPLKLVDQPCKMPKDSRGVKKIANFTAKCNVDANLILSQLAYHGPVVAVVNARPWVYYNSGVIQYACDSEWINLQHAIQIVGYDLTDEIPHYIIRNSWGADFGDNGYVKLAIKGNVCGIRSNVAYLDVK